MGPPEAEAGVSGGVQRAPPFFDHLGDTQGASWGWGDTIQRRWPVAAPTEVRGTRETRGPCQGVALKPGARRALLLTVGPVS